MKACTEYVRYQLPNQHSCICYVLDDIETSDAQLLAAMENIEEDIMTTGNHNSFESSVAYLLPKDPVSKRWNNDNKCNQAQISDTSVKGQGFGYKVGIWNTSVHFREHTNTECHHLNYYQKNNLGECHKDRRDQGYVFKIKKNNNNSGDLSKKQKALSSSIEKKVE